METIIKIVTEKIVAVKKAHRKDELRRNKDKK